MNDRTEFRPDRGRYMVRCFLDVFWVAVLVNAGLSVISIVLLLDEHTIAGFAAMVGVNVLGWLVAALYTPAWVAAVRYEMTDEEVIVHKGVFNRIHKIVPYRTVTNVSIKRGFLDRIWLGLGNVNIQTAGSGGTSVAEERLVGLRNFEEIRDAVVGHLRRYRADTGPALGGGAAGPSRPAGQPSEDEASDAILEELRAIRELLQQRA